MEAPKVLTFMVRFMSDEQFRFDVLSKERTTMLNYGLTDPQITTLCSLNTQDITDLLVQEAKNVGADIAKAFGIIFQGQPCDAINTLATPVTIAAQSMYNEGKIHIRCVDTSSTTAGTVQIWLRAHGFGPTPEFEFRLQTNPAVRAPGTVIEPAQVGDDLFQRVRVEATLAAGTWQIFARNHPSEDFDTMTEPPIKTVTLT